MDSKSGDTAWFVLFYVHVHILVWKQTLGEVVGCIESLASW
jgi:hypothetical protein